MPEIQFDGLVGPTHNYAGLSRGNPASTLHEGRESNPRAAAHQGLEKMGFVRSLGVVQAVLPPHDRPSLPALCRLGFHGSDEEILAAAAKVDGGRLHLTPANLTEMFHRGLEAPTTTRVLRAIFASGDHFVVHDALPGGAQF